MTSRPAGCPCPREETAIPLMQPIIRRPSEVKMNGPSARPTTRPSGSTRVRARYRRQRSVRWAGIVRTSRRERVRCGARRERLGTPELFRAAVCEAFRGWELQLARVIAEELPRSLLRACLSTHLDAAIRGLGVILR